MAMVQEEFDATIQKIKGLSQQDIYEQIQDVEHEMRKIQEQLSVYAKALARLRARRMALKSKLRY